MNKLNSFLLGANQGIALFRQFQDIKDLKDEREMKLKLMNMQTNMAEMQYNNALKQNRVEELKSKAPILSNFWKDRDFEALYTQGGFNEMRKQEWGGYTQLSDWDDMVAQGFWDQKTVDSFNGMSVTAKNAAITDLMNLRRPFKVVGKGGKHEYVDPDKYFINTNLPRALSEKQRDDMKHYFEMENAKLAWLKTVREINDMSPLNQQIPVPNISMISGNQWDAKYDVPGAPAPQMPDLKKLIGGMGQMGPTQAAAAGVQSMSGGQLSPEQRQEEQLKEAWTNAGLPQGMLGFVRSKGLDPMTMTRKSLVDIRKDYMGEEGQKYNASGFIGKVDAKQRAQDMQDPSAIFNRDPEKLNQYAANLEQSAKVLGLDIKTDKILQQDLELYGQVTNQIPELVKGLDKDFLGLSNEFERRLRSIQAAEEDTDSTASKLWNKMTYFWENEDNKELIDSSAKDGAEADKLRKRILEATKFNSAISNLVAKIVKIRSGAAVTDSERALYKALMTGDLGGGVSSVIGALQGFVGTELNGMKGIISAKQVDPSHGGRIGAYRIAAGYNSLVMTDDMKWLLNLDPKKFEAMQGYK